MVLLAQDTQFIAEHEMDFGRFRFYKNLVIGQIHEGTHVTLDNVLPVLAIGTVYYNESNRAVYLSDRKYSYSIDPTMHLELHKLFPYLLGYGVVVQNDLNFRIAKLEQKFLPCSSGVFFSMDQALDWASNLIQNRS